MRGRERGNVVTKGFSSNSVSRTSGEIKKNYIEKVQCLQNNRTKREYKRIN